MGEKENCPPEQTERAEIKKLKRTVFFLSVAALIQTAAIFGLFIRLGDLIGTVSEFSQIVGQLNGSIAFLIEGFDQILNIVCSFYQLA